MCLFFMVWVRPLKLRFHQAVQSSLLHIRTVILVLPLATAVDVTNRTTPFCQVVLFPLSSKILRNQSDAVIHEVDQENSHVISRCLKSAPKSHEQSCLKLRILSAVESQNRSLFQVHEGMDFKGTTQSILWKHSSSFPMWAPQGLVRSCFHFPLINYWVIFPFPASKMTKIIGFWL